MSRVVKNLSVMRTDESDRALKTIMETGMDQSTATRWALNLAANVLRHAWMNGHADLGTVPQMRVQYKKKGESS